MRELGHLLASIAFMLLALSQPALAQNGNPRLVFSQIDKKVVVKLPVERVCWVMGGSRNSLFGLSASADGQVGVLFTDKSPNAVLELEALVTLRASHIGEPTNQWNANFTNMGSTDGREFVYATSLSPQRFDQVLGSGVISFTSNYRTERGLGVINVAHVVDFTQRHIDELVRCARSF
jgi:hypothetical protein